MEISDILGIYRIKIFRRFNLLIYIKTYLYRVHGQYYQFSYDDDDMLILILYTAMSEVTLLSVLITLFILLSTIFMLLRNV